MVSSRRFFKSKRQKEFELRLDPTSCKKCHGLGKIPLSRKLIWFARKPEFCSCPLGQEHMEASMAPLKDALEMIASAGYDCLRWI